MIFITGFIGFASAGILNLVATDRLGFGKVSTPPPHPPDTVLQISTLPHYPQVVVIASVCQIIGYALQFWYPPFPVFAISFLIIGFGTSWQDAQTNSIVNRFEKPEMRMQFLHAAYGGLGVFYIFMITTTTTSPQGSRTDVICYLRHVQVSVQQQLHL
jgi:MFS family permease